MQWNYYGLPAAANVEQAILEAQRLILTGREQWSAGWTQGEEPFGRSPHSTATAHPNQATRS